MSDAMAIRHAGRSATAFAAADWLCLAAAPTFALMALLTAQGASPLGGMVPMYVLMSAVHSAPWLKLISSRRNRARRETGAFNAAGSPFPSRTSP